jgi:hypothetical protein
MEHAFMCPQCNAPLAPHRFARTVVCSFCGATVQLDESAISAKTFHDAYRAWNSPDTAVSVSLGENHWALGTRIASGDVSDVYAGRRARWPTELVIIKLLRDRKDAPVLENEWSVIERLQQSNAQGAETFTSLLPQPVMKGEISAGARLGTRAYLYRWSSGFRHTFEDVRKAYPHGVTPRASVWMWRRMLEILSFVHRSGFVHGAVLPSHLLVQDNEHGVRLVAYGAAGRTGDTLQKRSARFESFYPPGGSALTEALDLSMSARCIVDVLGGDAKTIRLPQQVPVRLAQIIAQVAAGENAGRNAWSLREELGTIARDEFGAPQFVPIVMPD